MVRSTDFFRFNTLIGDAENLYDLNRLDEHHIELPVNKPLGGRFQLVGKLLYVSFLCDLLHTPLHAGAYVYGRRPSKVVLNAGQPVKRHGAVKSAEEASVFIPDYHPGYISREEY